MANTFLADRSWIAPCNDINFLPFSPHFDNIFIVTPCEMLLASHAPYSIGSRNITVSNLVEVTKFGLFIAGLPSTMLYADRQSTIRKFVIVVV